jgi:hypothetical protein
VHLTNLDFSNKERARINSKKQTQLPGDTASKPCASAKKTNKQKSMYLLGIWVHNCQARAVGSLVAFTVLEKPTKATSTYVIKLFIYIFIN